MEEVAAGIDAIDTRFAGLPEVTAAYLVRGPRPALVDPGAQTSVETVRSALAAAGLGPDDLGWIVLTHVHLDHCGGTGGLAAAFPAARVVVHPRGARHLAEPERLVRASWEVFGARRDGIGGLDPTDPARIDAAEDGHRLDLGGGDALRMVWTPGHARHHMSVLHEGSGAVLAGDAVGVRFPGSGLHPSLPPSEVDPAAGDRSLALLSELRPTALCLAHYGPVPDAAAALDRARVQLALVVEAAAAARAGGDLRAEMERRLPLVGDAGDGWALERWRTLGWAEDNLLGVGGWMAREGTAAP